MNRLNSRMEGTKERISELEDRIIASLNDIKKMD